MADVKIPDGVPEINHSYFPSISYYFHIPIIFDYLDFHCPTEVMAVGTIIFLVRVEEHFFSNIVVNFLGVQVHIRQI